MRSNSFGLSDLRTPFSRTSTHKRNASSFGASGLLDQDGYEALSTSRSSRRRGMSSTVNLLRIVKWILGTIVALVIIFFWKYELHIELQLFNRGWIRSTILPVVPTSSHCFSPSHISTTSYNLSLSTSPTYVDFHSGISLPLGNDCYSFASTLPTSPLPGMNLPEMTIIHLYWRNDLLPLGKRQINLIESILFTQDEKHTRIIFWTNAQDSKQVENLPILQPLLKQFGGGVQGGGGGRFEIKKVVKTELALNTPMESSPYLELADTQAWVDGDLVRILVLYNYGGVWIDFDTVLTGKRDLRVLLEHEWVTQWDCYDKIYQPLNGAMMHFFQNSPYLCEMLYTMSTSSPPTKNSVDWGSRLYHKVYRSLIDSSIKPFKILPYCFTDGVSCRLDNRLPDPFDSQTLLGTNKWGKGRWEQVKWKLENVWAVHLHNRWDKGFPKGGYIDEMVLKPIEEKKSAKGYKDQL
ncbi:hypothetical protein JCM3765_007322 [Sporobolomyces pararoseus]